MKPTVDFRVAIQSRLKELDRSTYWLWKQTEEKGVSRNSLYSYLAGDTDTIQNITPIMQALGLVFTPLAGFRPMTTGSPLLGRPVRRLSK